MVEWTTYLFFRPVRLTSSKTHPAHGNLHPGSMPPVNRGYVPGLSFPPRALAAARLGEGLTPFPKPPAQAQLVRRGVYAMVRHPVYAGLMALSLGWACL